MFSWFGNNSNRNDPSKVSNNKENSNTSPRESESPQPSSANTSIHGFDPTALERAAKAARELDRSSNAREAASLIKYQEATKQKELEVDRARFLAHQQELAIQRVREEELAANRTLEKQTQHDKARAEYRDKLERQRITEQMNTEKQIREEERVKNEESFRRQEAIRRKTLEYEAELKQQTEAARVRAEALGRIQQERENHDLVVDKIKLEAREYRDTQLESLRLVTSNIGFGLQQYLSDREKLTNTAVTLTSIAFGVYFAKTSIGVVGRYVESVLGKPSLVRETSRISPLQVLRSPIHSYHEYRRRLWTPKSKDAMKGIVLDRELEVRLQSIAQSTFNTKKNSAPYRHLLLYGPPGTGKTMFAKSLAKHSGMDYAIMTGGDIAPLGTSAVTEIHKLFDWANTTRKGVIIFVDEADAFLRKRSTQIMSENARNALNAFLYRTGESSNKFMVVFASNQPDQLDWAINDRIDDLVEINVPKYQERYRIIAHYIDLYLLTPRRFGLLGWKKIISVDEDVNEQFIQELAHETAGFSGREISKLAIGWQAAAYGTENMTINRSMMKSVLKYVIQGKNQKKAWLTKTELESLTQNDE